MNEDDTLTLYDYNYWATARVLNAAARLTSDQFTARAGLVRGSVRAYPNSLSDEVLTQTLHYKTTKGVPYVNVLWNLLAHVVNHGTQFRGEAGMALTAHEQSPGDLDLLLYFREKMA